MGVSLAVVKETLLFTFSLFAFLADTVLGLTEAGYYPGLNWMIGSWYRKDEMAKRAGILNASGSAAQLFSGFLMTGVINLGGRGGLPGWKWYASSARRW
jgi:hypothetical protein